MEPDKEKGGEEQGKSGSESKQNGNKSSNSSRYPLRLRNPDLYNCHVCGSQIIAKRGRDNIRTLDSQWRIVIICNACFKNVQSAKKCSYCFLDLDELGVCCGVCSRRVHRDCKSMYGRLNSSGGSGVGVEGSFTCVDCWVPKSINKVGCGGKDKRKSNGKVNGGSSIASNSSSLATARVVSDDRGCCLEAAGKDGNLTAEAKVTDAGNARGEGVEKAVVEANALNLAAVTVTEESHVNGSCSLPVVDDKELALQLHRAINSSSRILRNMRSMKLDDLVSPEKMRCDGHSLSMQSDQGNQVSCNLEVGTNELIFENPDDASSEPSVQISTGDRGSDDIGISEPGRKMEPRERCELKVFKRRSKSSKMKMPDFDYCAPNQSAKEDHISSSSKEAISNGYCNSTESGSQRCQNQEGLNHSVVFNNKTSLYQSVYVKDSSTLKNKSFRGPDMFLRKYSRRSHIKNTVIKTYSRRRQIQNMYVRKYSRCRTRSQLILDHDTNIHSDSLHHETQASGAALPLMKMNTTEMLVSSDSHVRSHFPLQDSTSASNPSWHCSQVL